MVRAPGSDPAICAAGGTLDTDAHQLTLGLGEFLDGVGQQRLRRPPREVPGNSSISPPTRAILAAGERVGGFGGDQVGCPTDPYSNEPLVNSAPDSFESSPNRSVTWLPRPWSD